MSQTMVEKESNVTVAYGQKPSWEEVRIQSLLAHINALTAQRDEWHKAFDTVAEFMHSELIANETDITTGYPRCIKDYMAKRCVTDGGWPSIDDAMAYLEEEFTWS